MNSIDSIFEQIELQRKSGESIDIYPDSTYEMDCCHNLMAYDCPMCMSEKSGFENPNSRFFATSQGFGVTHESAIPSELGALHDTFKVDRYDNIYDGHTTYQSGSNTKRITELDEFTKRFIENFK